MSQANIVIVAERSREHMFLCIRCWFNTQFSHTRATLCILVFWCCDILVTTPRLCVCHSLASTRLTSGLTFVNQVSSSSLTRVSVTLLLLLQPVTTSSPRLGKPGWSSISGLHSSSTLSIKLTKARLRRRRRRKYSGPYLWATSTDFGRWITFR